MEAYPLWFSTGKLHDGAEVAGSSEYFLPALYCIFCARAIMILAQAIVAQSRGFSFLERVPLIEQHSTFLAGSRQQNSLFLLAESCLRPSFLFLLS